MEKITDYLIRSTVNEKNVVRAWEEEILLPTYPIGEEEKNPVFLEKRVYQGSSGSVYPYPVVEKIADEKVDKPYKALFLENEYLKIMILPELGGRVQMAYDKIKQRHFVYFNQVIKPALVGLTGPWISGGIEFNWPQHHRPSTFLPTDYAIEAHADGSKTVWCNELERMFRTKGMQGFTLYPDKAYLEISVKIYNRTPFPQTFLWWANPAVVVHDDYHSVFPPDVHAVYDHGKRDVSDFPIATGVYYKQDYAPGTDISRYKNIPVPTSFMAVSSEFDFVGGYEENCRGGLLHVADHHIAPGKKQWTWGYGDFGMAWHNNLTDDDGPYIELMTGAYTDNQPDFSWLQPYEEKSWKQYFMPYSEVGYVKNASKDAIVNIDVNAKQTQITLYATAAGKNLQLLLKTTKGAILLDNRIDVDPRTPYKTSLATNGLKPEDLIFELYAENGFLLLRYRGDASGNPQKPSPAAAMQAPEDISSTEQLYLAGLHLEQYRHATYNPLDYYLEALRRDSGDIRCNNAVGLYYMRRGQFGKAEPYFRQAIKTQTQRNPNPYDGEPYYNLGWSLKMQQRFDEAYEAFYKSAWNAAWQDAAYFSLAQIDCMRAINRRNDAANGKSTISLHHGASWEEALDKAEKSLVRNWHNHKARQLKATILRKMGKTGEALQWVDASLELDLFNMGCLFEKYLLTEDNAVLLQLNSLMRHNADSYIEYALDYAAAGLYEEAIRLLREALPCHSPLVYYTLGYIALQQGAVVQAMDYYAQAARMNPEKCFPNRLEEVVILHNAMLMNRADAKAPYYLGNFWYASQQYSKAIACWEQSIAIDDTFPTALRNLALAYYNKKGDQAKALQLLEKAFQLDPSDPRILMELDQLYKKLNYAFIDRLQLLESHLPLVEQRDDLYIERVTLYNQLGRYDDARRLMAARKFHPWEGGEGKVTGQYLRCHLEPAQQAIREKRFEEALQLLQATEAYPKNLGEGKLNTIEENDVNYYKGIAYLGLGDQENARHWLTKATQGADEPQQAFFYNDPQPDQLFYQALAWRALGNPEKAESLFRKLIDYGKAHLHDQCRIDYFAVSLPELAIWDEDLNKRNVIHCHYMMGLGYLGMNEKALAETHLKEVLEMDVNHQGAQSALKKENQTKYGQSIVLLII